MKILFLAQRVPFPPNKGDKLRSFNQLRSLSKSHQIDLVCLADSEAELSYAGELKALCRSVEAVFLPGWQSNAQAAMGLLTGKPLTLSYFHSSRLRDIVDQKLQTEQYDVIFVFCSSMAQYVEQVTQVPRVIDFVDVDSEKWHQYAGYAKFPKNHLYRLESRRLRRYEAQIAGSYQQSFFVSEKEAEDFKRLVCACDRVTPILNGVDLEAFCPTDEPYDPRQLVFTGAMDYFANVEAVLYFVRSILPLIQRDIPEVKFYVVGSKPTKEVCDLPAAHPNVVVTGFVDAVQPYVRQSAVLVAPMRIARGVQNKILEGMAMGVPVVTSSLGFEGITAVFGQDLFVEDDPAAFARQVVELMQNAELRRQVAERGRKAVEQHYRWEDNLETLERMLEQLAG